jgi:hypothetical protein
MRDLKLASALMYLNHFDYSVIPICKDSKKPLIKWEQFQKRHPSESELRKWFKDFNSPNIAIVTGSLSGVSVVDIDEPQGEVEMEQYITDRPPVAITPRGGKHMYFKTPSVRVSNNVKVIPGCDFRGEGGYIIAPPSDLPSGGYHWLTPIELVKPPLLPEAYIARVTPQEVAATTEMFKHGRRDEDLFHVANALARGGMPRGEIMDVLCTFGDLCVPPFPRSEIREKVSSAVKRHNAENMTSDIMSWIDQQDGQFTIKDIYSAMCLSSREEKKHVSGVLSRLIKDNVITRYGSKTGDFRKIDEEVEDINWKGATGEPMDIWLPLNLHKMSHTYTKNIIIFAGAPNSGKTALLLNIVKENMNKHKISYFSSEMSPLEMRIRLEKFPVKQDDWRFSPKERMENFADVIDPNGVNIIDFMEIYDDFWRVAKPIREIHDKLENGIAIIALQKNAGKSMGTGGTFGLHKPRLYVAVDYGSAYIVKGKNCTRKDRHLDGLGCKFDIYDGWDIRMTESWRLRDY